MNYEVGQRVLINNAINNSFDKKGKWLEENNDAKSNKAAYRSIRCNFDEKTIDLNVENCGEKHIRWGKRTFIHNTFSSEDKVCSRINIDDHEIYIAIGALDFYNISNTSSDLVFSNVAAMQVLLNYDPNEEKDKSKAEYFDEGHAFMQVSGDEMGTPKNNILMLDYNSSQLSNLIPNQHSLYAIMHPKNASSVNVDIKLPYGYDHFFERPIYEKGAHSLKCEFK